MTDKRRLLPLPRHQGSLHWWSFLSSTACCPPRPQRTRSVVASSVNPEDPQFRMQPEFLCAHLPGPPQHIITDSVAWNTMNIFSFSSGGRTCELQVQTGLVPDAPGEIQPHASVLDSGAFQRSWGPRPVDGSLPSLPLSSHFQFLCVFLSISVRTLSLDVGTALIQYNSIPIVTSMAAAKTLLPSKSTC